MGAGKRSTGLVARFGEVCGKGGQGVTSEIIPKRDQTFGAVKNPNRPDEKQAEERDTNRPPCAKMIWR